MLLLHNNSLGDIIDTEKEKTKQEKKKKKQKISAWPWAAHIPSLWFLLCWFKDFAKKNLFFFS